VTVDDEELGPTRVCNVFPRFSRTPGRVDHLGPATPGAHTDEVLQGLGYTDEELTELRHKGVV
jgi:crotonobetainyl-CoA:carnitine CoA-transferase CaiB-like acyl-CoA transferase